MKKYFYSKIRKDGHSHKILIPIKLLNYIGMKKEDEVEIVSNGEGSFIVNVVKEN